MKPLPILKAGVLAYIDSMRSGLVPCKVLSIKRDTSGVMPRDVVTFVVTATRTGYPRGHKCNSLSSRIIVPRTAVYRIRGQAWPRIVPYTIECDTTEKAS